MNYIDPLRTSFYPANGGNYNFGTFVSEFALNGAPQSIRGPLVPGQNAAAPLPATTPLGELAPAAGPGSEGSPGAVPPDNCAVGFMTNFWNWYTQCQTAPPGTPQ